MKLSLLSLSAVCLALLSLTSCDSLSGGGYDVKDPTREQMLELDRQWGLPDITKKSKTRSGGGEEMMIDRSTSVQSIQQNVPPPAKIDPIPAEPAKPQAAAPSLPDAEKLKTLR